MAIVRWDPFRELTLMQDRLNRLFGDAYGQRSGEDLVARGAWMPAVDIYETDDHDLVVKCELPEIRRENIDLRIENNLLTIRGERTLEKDVKEEQFHRVERSYGAFTRSFSLPSTVDAGKVKAEYRDGVLTVTLPRREESKPKQIPVAVN